MSLSISAGHGGRRVIHLFIAGPAAAGLFAVAACSGPADTPSATAQAGGSLTVVAASQPWSSLDPAAPVVTGFKGLLYQIYDSLLRLSPDGKLVPWLATSWSPSSDGLSWTFKLQQGVQFQDGTPFNAAAVKFNLERQISPDQHAGEGSNLPKDLKVTAPDDTTVVVTLTSPDAALPWALASTGVGLMASPTAVQKFGKDYGLHPVGTGPFRLDNQVVGQTATLAKWEHYWVPSEPKLDTVTFRFIPSAESALQTVTTGGAQIMDMVEPLQAQHLSDTDNLSLVVSKATGVNQIWLNTRVAPFNDVRARRAVGYAIDQATLSKNLFYDIYKPTQSIIASGSWAYPGPDVSSYPSYNIAEAKKLVAELGGLSFTYTIANNTTSQEVSAAVQAQLAQAGITMTLKPEEETALIGDEFTGNYQASNARVPGLPDPDSYAGQFFGSNKGPTGIDDQTLFDLFSRGRATTDETARAAVYKQVATRMGELAPTLFISENPPTKIVNKSVAGMVSPPFAGYYLDAATAS